MIKYPRPERAGVSYKIGSMKRKSEPTSEVKKAERGDNDRNHRFWLLLLLFLLGLFSSCLLIFDLFYHFRPRIVLEAVPRTSEVASRPAETPIIMSTDDTFLEIGVIEEDETPEEEPAVIKEAEIVFPAIEIKQEIQEPEQEPEPEPEQSVDEVVLESVGGVPEAPVFFEPYVSELSENDIWADFETTSDDFWDDFVFSDEAPAYFEGINYVPIYINGEYFSNIETNITQGSAAVSRSELSSLLYGLLTEQYYDVFFESPEEYYSIDYMTEKEAQASFEIDRLEIYLDFNADQFPVKEISVSSAIAMNSMRDSLTFEGAKDLEPADFAAATNLSLFGTITFNRDLQLTSNSLGLSAVTYLSFFESGADLSYSLSKTGLSINSFRAYYDFADENVRLTFGHIGTASSIFSGNAFGLSLERSYSYGTGSALASQYSQSIVVEQASIVEVFINDVSCLKRSLKVGNYQLKDFAFVQGANNIKVVITPLTGGEPSTYSFFTGFDNSLLAKGEHFWKLSAAVPESTVDSASLSQNGDFRLPWIGGEDLLFKLSDLSLGFEHRIGIADAVTISDLINASLTLSSDGISHDSSIQGNFGLVWANKLGTTSVSFNSTLTSRYLPAGSVTSTQFSMYLAQSFNAEVLRPLSFNFSYNSASTETLGTRISSSILSTNIGYSFPIQQALRAGLSASLSYSLFTGDLLWSASGSIGGTFLAGLSLSANLSLSNSTGRVTPSLSIGGSYVVGPKTSVSASTAIGSTSAIGISQKIDNDGKHSLQLNIGQIDFADILNHTLNLNYSYNGSLLGGSLRFGSAAKYSSFTLGLSANTALAYADGAFGMAKSISSNFLLVKPQGILKSSDISVARATDSTGKPMPKLFSTVVYTGLSAYSRNSVVVYGTTDSLFGSGGLFLFNLNPKARQGYVAEIAMTPSVTVSGVLMHADGTVYDQYSSPIYQLQFSSDGKTVTYLDMSAGYYLFTDQDGRYIVSDLPSGTYCFDLQVEGGWYGVCFVVPELEQASVVVELETYTVDPYQFTVEPKGIPALSDYQATVMLSEKGRVDETTFWDSLFTLEEGTVAVESEEEFVFLE